MSAAMSIETPPSDFEFKPLSKPPPSNFKHGKIKQNVYKGIDC